jgi:hypothetical protein
MCPPIGDIPVKEGQTTVRSLSTRTGESRYGDGDLLSVPAIGKDGAIISVEFTVIPLKDIVAMAAMMRDATKKFEEMRALKRQLKGWSQGAALNYRDSMYLRVNRGDQPETSQLVEPMIRLRYPRFANALQ